MRNDSLQTLGSNSQECHKLLIKSQEREIMIHLSPVATWLLLFSIGFVIYVAMSALYANSLQHEIKVLKEELEKEFQDDHN